MAVLYANASVTPKACTFFPPDKTSITRIKHQEPIFFFMFSTNMIKPHNNLCYFNKSITTETTVPYNINIVVRIAFELIFNFSKSHIVLPFVFSVRGVFILCRHSFCLSSILFLYQYCRRI